MGLEPGYLIPLALGDFLNFSEPWCSSSLQRRGSYPPSSGGTHSDLLSKVPACARHVALHKWLEFALLFIPVFLSLVLLLCSASCWTLGYGGYISAVAWARDEGWEAPPRLHILTVTEQVCSCQRLPYCSREENARLLPSADSSPSPDS